MYKIKYFGIAEKGKVKFNLEYQEAYHTAIRKLEGQEIEVTVTRKSKANTRAEQKYFRGVIVKTIAAEIGEDERRAYEILQAQFFEYEDPSGRKYIRSTELGEWTTVDWEAKMEDIRRWALDFLNVRIPTPNEVEI